MPLTMVFSLLRTPRPAWFSGARPLSKWARLNLLLESSQAVCGAWSLLHRREIMSPHAGKSTRNAGDQVDQVVPEGAVARRTRWFSLDSDQASVLNMKGTLANISGMFKAGQPLCRSRNVTGEAGARKRTKTRCA